MTDKICRMELSVLLHVLQREGVITKEDIIDMGNGTFRFKDRGD